ncbi:MAG: ethylbenzene dehydrogenase-related protein [Deltaproteobacteria bacterium]|nr:ethylbenzene dehydrogenase-related protein [Deltaproteobacteria bacterium]
MKAGIYGKEVFFIFKWADTTHDTLHRPFVWNEEKQRYIDGDQREDRLAMQWEMSGDFTHDWQSGKSFIADMWHWKSARSNPIGLAHDKIINISTNPSRKAIRIKGKGGQSIYIKRDSDDGDIYKSERVKDVRQDDVMLRYHLLSNPKGSVADVSAKGVWQNNEWTLELSRKLNTGQKDDAVFIPGKTIRAAIAIFDRTGGDEHNISDTLVFQF